MIGTMRERLPVGRFRLAMATLPTEAQSEIRAHADVVGVQVNGAAPSSWTSKVATKVKPPVGFQGLIPGTVYAFQVRALGKVGYTDWTDSATCMRT